MKEVDLAVKLGKVVLPNPLVLGSGPPGHSPSGLAKYSRAGCGAVITKTLTREPRKGNPHPRVIRVPGSNLINAEGTPNLGIKEYGERLAKVIGQIKGAVLVISVSGKDVEDFVYLAESAEKMGAQVVDIDISCPNIGQRDATIGGAGNWQLDPGLLKELVKAVKKAIRVPLWVKMTNQYGNLLDNARSAARAGADALIPLPLVGGLPLDWETAKPMLTFSHGVGLVTGPAIKYAGIKLVADLCRVVDVPVLGSGGCSSARDVAEYVMAGASAVQVLTAFMYEGPPLVGQILAELEKFMQGKGYKNLAEFRGAALKHLPPEPFPMYYRPV